MKYLLDTNVLSELVLKDPQEGVVERFQESESLMAIASVVWHELLYGVGRLPESSRRQRLDDFVQTVIRATLPVLPYDEAAARWHAEQRVRLSQAGLTPAFADGQIAAVAATRGLILVTRNESDFRNFEELKIENWHSE